MSADNSKAGTWGQLMVAPGTDARQQRALPADIEAHIRALTAPDTEPLPLDTQRWIRAIVREYAAGEQRLDEVMGLAPSPSRRDWRTIDKLETRNAWLIRAFELLGDAGRAYSRCVELSKHIHIFEEAFWPGWEECTLPPEDTTPFRRALFFAFKFGNGTVPHDWRQLKKIVQNPAAASGTYPILWHVHADAYDQRRSAITINSLNPIRKSYMTYQRKLSPPHWGILERLSLLALHAWQNSDELQARHNHDLSDYHERILRQAMDCDEDKGELPALITDVLSQVQIENILKQAGVKSL